MRDINFDQQVCEMKKIVEKLNLLAENRPSKSLRGRRPRSASENRALLRAVVYQVARAKREGRLIRNEKGYSLKWNE